MRDEELLAIYRDGQYRKLVDALRAIFDAARAAPVTEEAERG